MTAIGRWEQRPLFVGEHGPMGEAKRSAAISMMANDAACQFGVPELTSAITTVLLTKETMRRSWNDRVVGTKERIAALLAKVEEYEERFRGWPALDDIEDITGDSSMARDVDRRYRYALSVRDDETAPHSG